MTLAALWLTTLAVCVVGSIIPLVNTEIYLISVSALSPPGFVLPLVVAATLGQVLGKVAMYYAGRGVLRVKHERLQRGVGALRARMEGRPGTARLLLFSSATVGFPPLYVMAVACGTVGMGFVWFLSLTTVGRFIHFAAVAYAPQLVKGWF